MTDVGFTILALFLNWGTAVLASVGVLIAVLSFRRFLKARSRKPIMLALLAVAFATAMVIANFPFNLFAFHAANKRAFHAMVGRLKHDDVVGKSKSHIAHAYGRPGPWSREAKGKTETWSYSPGPFLSYGSMDTIILEFQDDTVSRWYIDWF